MSCTEHPIKPVTLTPVQSEVLDYVERFGPRQIPRGVTDKQICVHVRDVFPDTSPSEIQAAILRVYSLGLIEKFKLPDYPEWRYEVPEW